MAPDPACKSCRHDVSADLRLCSGCKKVWYCSKRCQTANWVAHKFRCSAGNPITTADHLALAVHRNLMPEDEQTAIDYGFSIAKSTDDLENLLGLYIGLIERLKVSPKKLHRWRINGTLVQEIKKAFSQIPERVRGGYYPWFLQNLWILDGSDHSTIAEKTVREGMRRAWVYAGGSPTASDAKIETEVSLLPKNHNDCLIFCYLILSNMHPSPELPAWLQFGFCCCSTQEEEMMLGVFYNILLKACEFSAFLAAYEEHSLVSLFEENGLGVESVSVYVREHLRGFMTKNVWYLKQFVITDLELYVRSVSVDYGFMNCKNKNESLALQKVYRDYFAEHKEDPGKADPLKLHEACLAGKLYKYLSTFEFVNLHPAKQFKRFLKNPYPAS